MFLSISRRLNYVAAVAALSIGLGACGGGGGGSSTTTPTTVSISGKATYTDFQVGTNGKAGIDYDNPTNKPIRGAVVEIQSPPGTSFGTPTNTAADGTYTINAPAKGDIRVIIKAALGTPSLPSTTIIDNTKNGAVYSIFTDFSTDSINVSGKNLNAGSGWDGTAYTAARSAAPFAIMDVIFQAQQLVFTADSAAVFPGLKVNWSILNKNTNPGDKTIGEIGGAHYDGNEVALYFRGAKNLDTDEYDDGVIGHEWGHYFVDKFSRSDSFGGSHTVDDLVNRGFAFDEGFGTAMGAMVNNSPIYIDTADANQATAGVSFNLEQDTRLDTDREAVTADMLFFSGYYSELSNMEIVYDIFDSTNDDADTVALGFTPIYNVMVGGQKTTKSFTSIFSFLHYIKLASPANSAAIDAIATAENLDMTTANEFGQDFISGANRMYNDITAGTPLTAQTQNLFGFGPTDTPADAGDFRSKLYNSVYFKFTAPTASCFTLTATPTAPTTADLVISTIGNAGADEQGAGVAEVAAVGFDSVGEVLAFSINSKTANTTFTISIVASPASACA